MDIRVLGPVEARGRRVPGRRQRALLTLLATTEEAIPLTTIVDRLWGETPPKSAEHAVQVYVSELRKALPETAAIDRVAGGYRLRAPDDAVDARIFIQGAAEGRSLLETGEHHRAAEVLGQALGLWRGPLEAMAGDGSHAAPLSELRLAALEDSFDAQLRVGAGGQLVAALTDAVRAEPLRERLRGQLMLALYQADRQTEALVAYEDAVRAFGELGLEPSEQLRRLEDAILRREPLIRSEPPELRARRHLPTPATPLIGRGEHVQALVDRLGGDTRIVTVTGPGGIGKTRVALQAAHDLAGRFVDGVYFIGLAPLHAATLVGDEIARTLGAQGSGAAAEWLRGRATLLLLDNFEQVEEAAPGVASLLTAAPELRVLVTSRVPLRVDGEVEHELPSLTAEEAADLFVARARAVRLGFTRTETVDELCAWIDRLPLAIELVAARLRDHSLSEIVSSVPRLELASAGPRDVAERHRSLRNTIAWSYDLLTRAEQEAFVRLSVFSGGFEPSDSLAVCGVDEPMLVDLRERSLLASQDERYTMLETIREFAAERLDDGDVASRHASHFRALAAQSPSVRRTERELDWFGSMELAHDNVRTAFAWFLEHEPEEALAFADDAYRFWYIRGHYAQGRRAFELALAASSAASASERATALMYTAAFAFSSRDLDGAETLARQSLEVWRAAGDEGMTARSLILLATIRAERSAHDEALALVEEAVDLARLGDDEHLLAFAVSHLGRAAHHAAQYERARDTAREAVELLRAVGDTDGVRSATENLAFAALELGDDELAAEGFEAALDLSKTIGNPLAIADNLLGLVAVAARNGRAEPAAKALGAHASLIAARGLTPENTSEDVRERAEAQLMSALGEAAFAQAFTDGRELSVDSAVAQLGHPVQE